jgi:hypothetical protein
LLHAGSGAGLLFVGLKAGEDLYYFFSHRVKFLTTSLKSALEWRLAIPVVTSLLVSGILTGNDTGAGLKDTTAAFLSVLAGGLRITRFQ